MCFIEFLQENLFGSHCDKPLTYNSHLDDLPAPNLVFDIADRRHSTPVKTIVEEKKVHQFEKKTLRCHKIDQYTVNQDCYYFLFPFQTGLDELEDLCDKIEGISKASFLLNKTKVRKGYIRILIISIIKLISQRN